MKEILWVLTQHKYPFFPPVEGCVLQEHKQSVESCLTGGVCPVIISRLLFDQKASQLLRRSTCVLLLCPVALTFVCLSLTTLSVHTEPRSGRAHVTQKKREKWLPGGRQRGRVSRRGAVFARALPTCLHVHSPVVQQVLINSNNVAGMFTVDVLDWSVCFVDFSRSASSLDSCTLRTRGRHGCGWKHRNTSPYKSLALSELRAVFSWDVI